MEKILLLLPNGEREEFRKRCAARGQTMNGALRMLIQRDKYDFEVNHQEYKYDEPETVVRH